MNYEHFKAVWTRALSEAHLLTHWDRPRESIDLGPMDRLYEIRVGLTGPQTIEPFTVSATLSWRWRALESARTATTEEDLLTQLHGREDLGALDTDRRWMRVEIALRATLPRDGSRRMPAKAVWRRFVAAVADDVESQLPIREMAFKDGAFPLGWCGAPTAEVACEADGTVLLAAVGLEAWQPVLLPRQWDDPDREPDDDPDEAVGELAQRVRRAMDGWTDAVKVLRIASAT